METETSDDSVARPVAEVPIKGKEVRAIEKITAPTMDKESINMEDSGAGERPTPPPILLRTRGPCLVARPVVESAPLIAVA